MKAYRPNLATVAILAVVCFPFVAVSVASAQTSGRALEVAAQATMLRLSDFGATSPGVGGRLSFDLSRSIAAEGEFNFFPHDDVTLAGSARLSYHRRRADAFFGMKAGHRGERFGFFGKVRPGFARLTDTGVECPGPICALMLIARPVYRTEFALDTGGVVEFYPTARTVARVDLGDVMIRHRSLAPPCSSCTSHNFTSRLGVGFRF